MLNKLLGYVNINTRTTIVGLILLGVGVWLSLVKGDIPPNLLSLMQNLYLALVINHSSDHFVKMKFGQKEEIIDEKDTK